MTKFKLKIVTPSGIYQEVEVNQLNLRTTAGQVGILAHHMPLASGIEISEMSYIIDKQDRKSTRLNSSHLKLSRMPSSA